MPVNEGEREREKKSENECAVVTTASSGSPTEASKGKAANGMHILGKIELGKLVKFDRNDQVDRYLLTTEAIAGFVGVE